MKKNLKRVAIFISFILMMSFILTACGTPKTVEEYVESNSKLKEQIESLGKTSGLKVSIKDNDLIYTYDISTISGITADIAKSDEMKNQLETSYGSMSGTFESLCSSIEEESKISGVHIVLKIMYQDEEVFSKTFSSNKQ